MCTYGFECPVFCILLILTTLCATTECDEQVGKSSEGEQCQDGVCDDSNNVEERKYLSQQNFNEDLTAVLDKLSDEQLQHLVNGIRDKTLTKDNVLASLSTGLPDSWTDDVDNPGTQKPADSELQRDRGTLLDLLFHSLTDIDDETKVKEEQVNEYEFPPLTRISPGHVGDSVVVALDNGKILTRITRSVSPPVFEIPDFLTDEECTLLINSALNTGLNVSNLFGSEINDEYEEDLDLSEISRVSEQTWLFEKDVGTDFWNDLQQRLSTITEVPLGVIKRGEPIQAVSYVSGGHYHAHLDTVAGDVHLPCCFQTRCGDKELTPEWAECCRLCRYMTVLYYLNDPDEGGETAFPLADMSEDLVNEKFTNLDEQEWDNLSRYCHNSSLVVRPKRGTAIMWYNHFIDEENGYLGPADRRSHHGGCDLIKGTKWIANNWISGTTFQDRFKPGVFYTGQ